MSKNIAALLRLNLETWRHIKSFCREIRTCLYLPLNFSKTKQHIFMSNLYVQEIRQSRLRYPHFSILSSILVLKTTRRFFYRQSRSSWIWISGREANAIPECHQLFINRRMFIDPIVIKYGIFIAYHSTRARLLHRRKRNKESDGSIMKWKRRNGR